VDEVNITPVNIISASDPFPVFMKYCCVLPSGKVVLILEVEAEDMPAPPWLETVVLFGSKESSFTIALSSFMVDANEEKFRIRESMKGVITESFAR